MTAPLAKEGFLIWPVGRFCVPALAALLAGVVGRNQN